MPTSPFGLAYGLGTMATVAPTAFNQMQNQDMQRKLQGLQLQQAQRQEAEQQALEQAATSVKPQMDTVTTPSLVDSAADLSSLKPSMEPASPEVQAGTTGPKGLNLPGAPAIPNAPTSAQNTQIGAPPKPGPSKQVLHKYTTPYEQAAYRSKAMADYLYKQGLPQIAMKLEQQSAQYSQQHQLMTFQNAARSASYGDYGAAVKMLHGVGAGITDMGQSPADPDAVRISSSQNGTPVYTDVPKNFIGAMIEDPAKAAQSFAMMNWHVQSSQEATKRAQMGVDARAAEGEKNRQSREKISGDRLAAQTAAYGASGKTPSKIAVWNFAEALVRKEHPDWSDSQVNDATAKHPLVSAATSSTEKTDRSIAAKMLEVIRKEQGGEPATSDPSYPEYQRLKQMALPALGKAPGPTPKTSVPEPHSKAEYDKLPSGAKYMKDGKTYIKG